MRRDKEISVVFISDDNYAVNTAVAITSLYKNRNKQKDYHVYIIAVEIDEKKLRKIAELEEDGFKISIIQSEHMLQEFYMKDFTVSPAAITKFFLAEILEDLDRVIYLDGDVIVQGDLEELFDVSLENKYAAVVRDVIAEKMVPSMMKRLKSNLKHYFNSGMMVLNLKKMRMDNISTKLLNYRRDGINYFMDQDALNIVFDENVNYISCKYNYMITLHENLCEEDLRVECNLDVDKTECERMMEAKILHLTGREKPWMVQLPYSTDIFMKYYRQGPFAVENLYKPLKRTNILQEQYLFPFELVEKGSNIAIWGAGKVGDTYVKQLVYCQYCKIVGWVDENWDSYREDQRKITTPDDLKTLDVDYIVIAIKREKIASDIKERLQEMGVEKGKIIWRYPVVS